MRDDPLKPLADLHRRIEQIVGVRLFTVTTVDRTAGLARRVYSSHPVEYPVTGTKPMTDDDWSRKVIDRHETFVANTTAEFAIYFPDHGLINALGCQSALNVPVVDRTEVVGTVNLLDVEGHFTPQRVALAEAEVAAARHILVPVLRKALTSQ
jgi:GAF domain-containing protein